jgi:glycosyltransferase involved in cell wall biosynthesis
MIIDSMELNGGSSMFLEMIRAIKRYYPGCEVEPLVVSKTGFYGRRHLVSKEIAKSYGVNVPSINYETFESIKDTICKASGTIVVHHRLQCTKPLHVNCPYVVINHTVQHPHRIQKFKHADKHISVCEYVRSLTVDYVKSEVILNGVENDYIAKVRPAGFPFAFKTGRCHRLSSTKFNPKSLAFLEEIGIEGHMHFLIGPSADNGKSFKKYKSTTYMGSVFNRRRKISILKDLDVYFYDSGYREGASIAILEALACGVPVICKPRGGNNELIHHGVNGFFFDTHDEAKNLLVMLSDPQKLAEIKEKVMTDFNNRLHIRHSVSNYMQIFTNL